MSDNKLLADYTFSAKYAKYNPEKMRRETYAEAVDRQIDMHLRKFPDLTEELEQCRRMMKEKKVIGSQRAMQFGGEAILEKNMRINNCSALHMNYVDAFRHLHWLLLCGTGVGFSVQSHHVSALPSVKATQGEVGYVIADSIEGWADAADKLMRAYFSGGARPCFIFDKVRPKGAALRFGGKAPGPEPLRAALEKAEGVLKRAVGRKLTPIEVFDIAMHLADSVVSGGIRRSATIVLFDPWDSEMLSAKTGNWFVDNPQRGRANISAVITPRTGEKMFRDIFKYTKEFGEPGFVFLASKEYMLNPCSEVLMCPVLIKKDSVIVENYTLDMLENREEYEKQGYTYESGVQICNLSEINMGKVNNPYEFIGACVCATILGTLQASYTEYPYLGEVSEQIVRRESLLGVSLTGVFSNKLYEDHATLNLGAEIVKAMNEALAKKIGIPQASRTTLIKPSGTASITLETCAGVHPWHSAKYIRRVQADAYEDLYRYVESVQPERCFKSAWGGEHARYIAFACEAPEGAMLKADLDALKHLSIIKDLNVEWVRAGTALPRLESAHHNVSCTVSVGNAEWQAVEDYLWENREFFTGVSLLGTSGDYDYMDAPYQEVSAEVEGKDHAEERAKMWELWNALSQLPPIDLSLCTEEQDNTELLGAVACPGGVCDITWSKPASN